jgi:hypothetical protein
VYPVRVGLLTMSDPVEVAVSLADALANPPAATFVKVDDDEGPSPLFARIDDFVQLRRLYLRCGLPVPPPRHSPTLV